jgi:hypothetical protein
VHGSGTSATGSTYITLIQIWRWYTRADPTAIQAGQFDFEAVVMYELGHALGLGHSADPTSVMDATLGAGTANPNLTVADLNVPDADGGGSSGLHARVPRPVPRSASAVAPPALSPKLGHMACDPRWLMGVRPIVERSPGWVQWPGSGEVQTRLARRLCCSRQARPDCWRSTRP